MQLCGDAHLSNFGAFAAPDRRLVFSINDFDETLPGPFEWDLKRLVASFAVAGRQQGFSAQKRRSIVMAAAAPTGGRCATFAGMGSLDVWYTRLDVDDIAQPVRRRRPRQEQTLRRDTATRRVEGQPAGDGQADPRRRRHARSSSTTRRCCRASRSSSDAEEAARFKATAETLVRSYTATLPNDRRVLIERYRFVDIARKVVGVGSVGTRAWVVLMLGRDHDDPLLLQVKEAQASVLEPYLGASRYKNHGQRVVEGQRLMQAASDILLGWERAVGFDGGRARLLRPPAVGQEGLGRGRADARPGDDDLRQALRLDAGPRPRPLRRPRGHRRRTSARSDTFDRAMADFAESYADQNERDHAALQQAIADGTVTAMVGV